MSFRKSAFDMSHLFYPNMAQNIRHARDNQIKIAQRLFQDYLFYSVEQNDIKWHAILFCSFKLGSFSMLGWRKVQSGEQCTPARRITPPVFLPLIKLQTLRRQLKVKKMPVLSLPDVLFDHSMNLPVGLILLSPFLPF